MDVTTKRKGLRRLWPVLAVLAVFLMIGTPLTAAADEAAPTQVTMEFTLNSTAYTVNGAPATMDVGPAIIEGRTLLPIRYVAEPLGAQVGWDEAARKATVSLGATGLELWIGKSGALINGQSVAIDPDNPNVKPLLISGRTMLPLRFVSEGLGCDVGWDPTTKKATVTKSGVSGLLPIQSILPLIPHVKPSITPGAFDFSKVTATDISKLKGTWGQDPVGKPMLVNPTEADIPMVMRLGCGYNVFGKYASTGSLKQPVLDVAKLVQDQRVERMRFNYGEDHHVFGESIRSYSNSRSVSLGAKGSFFGFGGSVNSSFDTARTQETNNYFATCSWVVKKYGVYVKQPTDLKKYLTPEADKLLNDKTVSPTKVFNTLGHFVLVDTVTGGRVDYNVTASSTASTSYENFRIAAKADFNALIVSAGGSADYQNVKNKAAYDSNKDDKLVTDGGGFALNINQLKADPYALTKWESTLENEGTLADFGDTTERPLVPIWELCTDFSRAVQLKAEFDKLNLAQGNQWPVQQYIRDIVFMWHKDEWKAKAQVPPKYQLIDVDLNAGVVGDFIYMAYLWGDNPNDAFTDFFMEFSDQERGWETKPMSHNTNYVNYTRNNADLNRNTVCIPNPANPTGSKRDNYIYLWWTKEKTLPPITGLDVALEDPDSVRPGWQSVCWQNTHDPADANHNALFTEKVYIKFNR